jgi:hypothetical protein
MARTVLTDLMIVGNIANFKLWPMEFSIIVTCHMTKEDKFLCTEQDWE